MTAYKKPEVRKRWKQFAKENNRPAGSGALE
jgi:hypothetical protein